MTTVKIRVGDVNDNAPRVENSRLPIIIRDGLKNGDVLYRSVGKRGTAEPQLDSFRVPWVPKRSKTSYLLNFQTLRHGSGPR